MQALGASYGLVSRENWHEVPLRGVIQEQLTPHQLGDGKRIVISGPDVMVKPAAALALGLVTHELTTNAAKYGSLSAPEGRVSIAWSIEHGAPPFLVLQWSESGGPPATEPTRKGFGTKLIEQEVKQTLGGSAKFSYEAGGLRAIVSIPFDRKLLSLGEATAH
jgi:two-component sensor histidine kinase